MLRGAGRRSRICRNHGSILAHVGANPGSSPAAARRKPDSLRVIRSAAGKIFRCDQSSIWGAWRHELAHIGVRHAEAFFEGLGEIGAVVAWVVELILIFNVQPAGVSYIG